MVLQKQDSRWRNATILLISLVLLISFFRFGNWKEECRGGDPWGYYAHLPALFIYGDVGDYQKTIQATQQEWHDSPRSMVPTAIGRQCDKYPIGVATLLSPFFLIGHTYTLVSGQPAEGFGRPYTLMCGLGVIFYVLCGLYMLFGVLRRYFSLPVTALLILALPLATNLFYFTTYNNMMAHALLFALYCFLLYAIHRFEDNPSSFWRAAAVGLAVGLITLTRLHEFIVVFIPILWGVYSWRSLQARMRFLAQHRRSLGVAFLVGAVVLFPQAAYYKFVSGQWLYYAYTGESFDFKHPKIWAGFTSYANGWLIYTPIMFFALIGILKLRRFAAPALGPILSFLPLHIYITYSWWCWYYINGLGSRPMVETYPLLAFPLGAFLSWGEAKRWKQAIQSGLIAFFAWLSIFQTVQVPLGIMWSENTNKAYFWSIFGKLHSSRSSLISYDTNEGQPDCFLLPVRVLAQNAMEDSTEEHRDTILRHGGRYSARVDGDYAGAVMVEPARGVLPGDWLRLSVWAFQPEEGKVHRPEDMANLVMEIQDNEGKQIKYCNMHISNHVGNMEHSIWSTGDTEQWGIADFFVRVPADFPSEGRIKAYIWNPRKQKIYVDDLNLELWRDGR